MDFDEMNKAMRNAIENVTKYPLLSAASLVDKERIEHALFEAPKAAMDRLNVNQFMERTKLEFPEVAFTGWEELLAFLKDYERLKGEVARLSDNLKRQRFEVVAILQNAMDQITRQLREPLDERTPPDYDDDHEQHSKG